MFSLRSWLSGLFWDRSINMRGEVWRRASSHGMPLQSAYWIEVSDMSTSRCRPRSPRTNLNWRPIMRSSKNKRYPKNTHQCRKTVIRPGVWGRVFLSCPLKASNGHLRSFNKVIIRDATFQEDASRKLDSISFQHVIFEVQQMAEGDGEIVVGVLSSNDNDDDATSMVKLWGRCVEIASRPKV